MSEECSAGTGGQPEVIFRENVNKAEDEIKVILSPKWVEECKVKGAEKVEHSDKN